MYLHEYDYIFAFGIIFAFFDAWNIGTRASIEYFSSNVDRA